MTAIIVSWNSAPDLPRCIASLPPDAAVVVDNASADDSVSVARDLGAEVIELPTNIGFAAAVNEGLSRATTPYVLLLNPDVTVGPGTIERCVSTLELDPTIGVVGPNTRLPDGRPEPPAARRDRSAVQILVESLGLVHLSRAFDLQMVRDRTRSQDVEAINGAFMLMRTDVVRGIGGLDETVFMYLEDQDLCRRVRDAGYRVRFVANAHAVHGNGTSTARGSERQQARAYMHRIDADLEFLRRYGRRSEVPVAIFAFTLRSLIGLAVSVVRPDRRLRYRSALVYSLRQLAGRRPPPPV